MKFGAVVCRGTEKFVGDPAKLVFCVLSLISASTNQISEDN